jgi:hypothetical protein
MTVSAFPWVASNHVVTVSEAGADVMKRIATPMIGGIVTSGILKLLIYPVIYVLCKKRGLKNQDESEIQLIPPSLILSALPRSDMITRSFRSSSWPKSS